MTLKKQQKKVLKALKDLGGRANIWEIAGKANLNINDVVQNLGAMYELVGLVSRDGVVAWEVKE